MFCLDCDGDYKCAYIVKIQAVCLKWVYFVCILYEYMEIIPYRAREYFSKYFCHHPHKTNADILKYIFSNDLLCIYIYTHLFVYHKKMVSLFFIKHNWFLSILIFYSPTWK